MKFIISLLSLLVATSLFGQTYTNGAFLQNEKTIEVDKKVLSFNPTNKSEILYFSDGLIAEINTNSDFLINSFFQEIYDIDGNPHKLKTGDSNLAATLMNGSAIFVYSGGNSNSSCVISTPLADLELYKGTFYFKVTDSKLLVFVIDGSLKAHSNKNRENIVNAGNAVVAFPNDKGILEDGVSLNVEKVKQLTNNTLVKDANGIKALKDNVVFVTVNKKIIGIVIN